ncbi:hypothetical protein [Parasutterella excrementihominis]|uniref:hypothetical protein n=1 Tax=Parasutterella excrementihominis TaxID=487175 RepID=UPI00242A667E|nr:hypothetical protein [Parasutterella excrementihominis]
MYGNKLTFLLERESLERIIRLIEVCDDLTKQLCTQKTIAGQTRSWLNWTEPIEP